MSQLFKKFSFVIVSICYIAMLIIFIHNPSYKAGLCLLVGFLQMVNMWIALNGYTNRGVRLMQTYILVLSLILLTIAVFI